MSHFTVLVVGDDVEGQLAPYHEFECTGEDDQYVQDIDITEEVTADWNKYTKTMWKDPAGELHDPYVNDTLFFRDMTPEEEQDQKDHPMGIGSKMPRLSIQSYDPEDGKGERMMVREIPFGWTAVEIPYREVESLSEFAESWNGKKNVPFGEEPDLAGEHKYGYVLLKEDGSVDKIIRRTNPERKWDWYQIGGRWTGFFKLKPLRQVPVDGNTLESLGFTDNELSELRKIKNKNGKKFENLIRKFAGRSADVLAAVRGVMDEYPEHSVGEPGLMTPEAQPGYADSCKKRYIDFETMRRQKEESAGKVWEFVHNLLKDLPPERSWEDIRDELCSEYDYTRIDEARKLYGEQPRVKALSEAAFKRGDDDSIQLSWNSSPEDFDVSKEVYMRRARESAVSTFAVVKDGKWFENGKMGWWGMVSDEKDEETWNSMFSKLLDDVPEDTLLTVVDCHI